MAIRGSKLQCITAPFTQVWGGTLGRCQVHQFRLLAEWGYFSTVQKYQPKLQRSHFFLSCPLSLSVSPKRHCLPPPPSLGSKKKQLTAFPEIFQEQRRRKETHTKNALVGERGGTAMPQKHLQARDRSQRLGSVKLVQTRQVSVLVAAGLVVGANLFAF